MRTVTFPPCDVPDCAFESTATITPALHDPAVTAGIVNVCPVHKRDFIGRVFEAGLSSRDIDKCYLCGGTGRFRIEEERDHATLMRLGEPIFRPFACSHPCVDAILREHRPTGATRMKFFRHIPACEETLCGADAVVLLREETRGIAHGVRRPVCALHRDKAAIDLLRAGLAIRFAKLAHQV